MMSHKFTLKPYTKLADRGTCPGCGKKRCFSPYIDTETGEVLADGVGRCDREVNCSYHVKPKQYFDANPVEREKLFLKPENESNVEPVKPTSFIADAIFNLSLGRYETNNLIRYLYTLLPEQKVREVIAAYQIGTSKHWPGSTVFWQISNTGEIRAGKIMLYNVEKGKRVKEPFNHITWVHKALKIDGYNLKQCFFGEHLLLIHPSHPVAIVESEKTAVIASAYLPEFVWLACGSLNNLSLARCAVLANKTVILFPDLNAFDKWQARSVEMSAICTVSTSDILERIACADEREKGLDLADYLIRIDNRRLSLRDEFKEEFLKEIPLDEKAQYRVWNEYQQKGLPVSVVKEVVNDLIVNHHFIVT